MTYQKHKLYTIGYLLGLIICLILAYYYTQERKLGADENSNFSKEISNKYKIEKQCLKKIVSKKNEMNIQIGNPTSDVFIPEIEVGRWGESFLKIKYNKDKIKKRTLKDKILGASENITTNNEKIIYNDGINEVHYYSTSTKSGEEGYEIEFVLNEKPDNNILEFDIETSNLVFYYQPPLNLEMASSTCSETDCGDVHRPENVVGSYAVYRADKKTGDFTSMGGNNYKSGKVFHIFRPLIIDSDGKKTWGILNINNNKLTIEIPIDFLKNATYPVYVDPTLGETSGSSTMGLARAMCSSAIASESGDVTKITTHFTVEYTLTNVQVGYYDDSGGSPGTNQFNCNLGSFNDGTSHTLDCEITGKSILSSNTYWLCAAGNQPSYSYIWYDTGGTLKYNTSSVFWGDSPSLPNSYSRSIEVYLTYTSTAAATTNETYIIDFNL